MSESFTLFMEKKHRGESNDDRRRVAVEKSSPMRGHEEEAPELMLHIMSCDQSATEFLTKDQFEKLVKQARKIMGWDK